MPQMMPLMWIYMLFFSTIMMLTLTSFIYFFIPYYHPFYPSHNIKDSETFLPMNKNPWNWKW